MLLNQLKKLIEIANWNQLITAFHNEMQQTAENVDDLEIQRQLLRVVVKQLQKLSQVVMVKN